MSSVSCDSDPLTPTVPTHDHARIDKSGVDSPSPPVHESSPPYAAVVHLSNRDLSEHERIAKRDRKRELKRQRKLLQLERKLQHATRRNDRNCVEETRKALQDMIMAECDDGHEQGTIKESHASSSTGVGFSSLVTPERVFIEDICTSLQRQHQYRRLDSKAVQSAQAVSLLRHMTKGTQSRSMFEDPDALWGYTRHKFFERALLVCSSFQKLDPTLRQPVSLHPTEHCLRRELWDRLLAVRYICSLGCGPGNDAVGVLAFLKHCSAITPVSSLLERATLLDWAISDWKIVLDPLEVLMMPRYIQKVDTSFCNVLQSMTSPENSKARDLLQPKELESGSSSSAVDLVLISYLLTELRGQWETCLQNLVHMVPPNTLFYFAEPTAWQLHNVRRVFEQDMDFVWIDSSMNHPELQCLDNRLGPGVLMGIKRLK